LDKLEDSKDYIRHDPKARVYEINGKDMIVLKNEKGGTAVF